MKKLSFLLPFALIFSNCQMSAQTKLISYKSHSGDMKFFEKSIVKDSYNTNYSNLGMAPQRYVTNSKLDSVIIIDDKKSVIVTSKFCKTRSGETLEKWKSGRDTVYNHAIFSNENIDSVKNLLRKNYHFRNNIDSTVFLKYDTKTKEYKPISAKKIIKKAEVKSLKSKDELLYLFVITMAVLASVFVYRKNR